MTEATAAQTSRVATLGFAVIGFVFLLSGFFRRELHAYNPTLYWVFDVLKFVVIPGFIAVVLAKRYGVSPKHYGLRDFAQSERWLQFIGLTVFLVLALALAYYVGWYVGWFIFRPEESSLFYRQINPSGFLRIPVTIYMAVTAGVVEEVFFRGIPLLLLERYLPNGVPRKAYVVGTAVLFGLIHWPNGPHEVLATFVFGLLAAGFYLRLRDLWPLIAAHTLTDLYSLS